MQAKRAFICGLLAATGICWGGSELIAQIRTYNNSQFYIMPDGVIMQSIRPEPSELAESLEIKRWHIRATLPPGSDADSFRYGVEIHKGDTPLHPSGGELFVPDGSRTLDVTVVLRPETPNWDTASSFSVWSSNNFPVRYDGLISSRHSFPNPFREKPYQGASISNHPYPRRGDGVFVLMSAHPPYVPGPVDEKADREKTVSVVFKLRAVNQRKEFPWMRTPQSPPKWSYPSWQAWFH